jgi:hypothetical protein
MIDSEAMPTMNAAAREKALRDMVQLLLLILWTRLLARTNSDAHTTGLN